MAESSYQRAEHAHVASALLELSLGLSAPDESSSLDLSLSLNAPVTTSSTLCTDESSSIMERVIPPQEEVFVAQKTKEILKKKENQFTCEDVLATQAKQTTMRKKRTQRIDCGKVVSNEVTEKLNISCDDALATPPKEPKTKIDCGPVVSNEIPEKLKVSCQDALATPPKEPKRKKTECGLAVRNETTTKKLEASWQDTCALATPLEEPKKRKAPHKKTECGPTVTNEITENLKNFIRDEINGLGMKLVIQKILYMSDLKSDQNRLNLPFNQLKTHDFLTPDEKRKLEDEKAVEVRLVGPTLQMYKEPMQLKIWKMSKNKNYVLNNKWRHFVVDNKKDLKQDSKIQVWSFRKDQQLWFAIAVVERPGTITI